MRAAVLDDRPPQFTLDDVPVAIELARRSEGSPRIVDHPNGDL